MLPRLALDTNAYRALDNGNPKLSTHAKAATQLGLPIIVLGELYYGIFLGNKQENNLLTLNRFLSLTRLELLHINDSTARIFGEIASELRQKGKPIQQDDMWIAALCKQYGYALATADKGFSGVAGLEVISF
ncbi:MAG TPA: type II toxin-antitoxin system VapC family toxin [Candidatus Saccharimonadales bacterium]|jgi:tRNA(fMet)-specific endonuclease VapC|nr:type II toxin-antitoxin system VapC family toxin [Candidatus Saccharimonadales bacterium]